MATATAVGSTVEVIGCTSNTETIELYFENKRRSGGGTISNLRRKGNVVLVTFDDPEAAERVAAQTHTLEGQELKVKLRATENIDNTTLIVKNVSRETTDDGLGYFLKDVTGSNVVHIDRERSRRTATVKFKPAIDVLEVIQEFDERSTKKKVLDRAELQLFPVNETRTVIIRHLPKGVSKDWLELYFENKRRSGGGDIDEISLDPSRTSAKVTFTESATIGEVIRRSHSFQSHSLSLSVFYDGVGDDSDESPFEDDDVVEDGCQSLEEDTPPVQRKQYVARKGKPSLERERTQQKAYTPPKKHLTDIRPEYTVPIDGDIIHFIEANKGYLAEFRDAMAAVDATTTRDIGEDTIRVVASKDVNGKSSKEDWEITSQTALAGVFGGYSKVSVPVVPQLWDEVLTDLEEVSQGVLKMKMDDREHEIQLIGKSSEVENARKKIQHAVQAHLEKMDRESRRKTSKINQQNRGKLFVLRQRLDAIRARHKDVDISIDLKLGHVTFTGCQEHEVQSAKCDVYQALDSIIEKRFRLKTCLASFLEGNQENSACSNY
ncbi:protein mono-ADP-ribosyltransferase PARP14-like [Ptychodera flava]|uniref:protein mono-ADP-ribosyltransferase PARP14-like n=1 Tax=Ptychodera flava TaxID=63121 RepID=UPI00396A0D09